MSQHKSKRLQPTALLLLGVFSNLFANSVFANLSGSVSATSEYHDNIALHPSDEEHDIEHILALGAAFNERYSRAEVAADYLFEESQYQQDTFDDRFIVEGRGSLYLSLYPERLKWSLENTRENIQISSNLPDVPTNRTERNILATGPTLTYPVSSVDSLSLDLRYIDTKNKDFSFNDSERYVGGLSWKHLLSATQNLELTANQSDVQYPLEQFDFIDSSVRLSYFAAWRQSQTTLWTGLSKIDPEVGESNTENEYGLSWRYNRTSVESFTLSFSREFTDSSIGSSLSDSGSGLDLTTPVPVGDISLGTTPIGTTEDRDAGISDVYNETRFELGYNRQLAEGYQLVLSLTARKLDYAETFSGPGINQGADQDVIGANLQISKTISSVSSVSFTTAREIADYTEDDRKDKVWQSELSYQYQLLPEFTIGTAVFYETQDSDLSFLEYDDFGVRLTLDYLIN